eukprot:6691465-Alexandrium_andersonii.AAC.1
MGAMHALCEARVEHGRRIQRSRHVCGSMGSRRATRHGLSLACVCSDMVVALRAVFATASGGWCSE